MEEMMHVFKLEGGSIVRHLYRKYTGDLVVNGKSALYVKNHHGHEE